MMQAVRFLSKELSRKKYLNYIDINAFKLFPQRMGYGVK